MAMDEEKGTKDLFYWDFDNVGKGLIPRVVI